MSTNQRPLITESNEKSTHNRVDIVLNENALRNLSGFFDVLIQMDLAAKRKSIYADESANTPTLTHENNIAITDKK